MDDIRLPGISYKIDSATRAAARSAVRYMSKRLGLTEQLRPYQAQFWSELFTGPTLYLDDVSELPFLSGISGVEEYQHRARVRAGDGDLFAAVTPPVAGYEDYCRDRLKLGRCEVVVAEPVEDVIAVAKACRCGDAFERIVGRARDLNDLAIHPYMSIEPVWSLARAVSAEAAIPVSVIGPPPPVTWLANDKALFSEVVECVLGPDWLVETHQARDIASLSGHLLDIARRRNRVALKRTRCTSAMGNEMFDSETLLAAGEHGVRCIVETFLERTEWDGEEDVLVVAWEETDLSPSTQLWIPPDRNGDPQVEGIYEQLLSGENRVFVGSRPSTLSAELNCSLARASLGVAAALQSLGYVGRCSFDFLVLGDPDGEFQIHFMECNGRWGGASIPMRLVDRLFPHGRPPYRAQDFIHPKLVGVAFTEILARVGEDVYDAITRRGRFVFYNPGPLAGAGKLDVIALGTSQKDAEKAIEKDLPRLLGL